MNLIVEFNDDRNCFITVPSQLSISEGGFTVLQCVWHDDQPKRVFASQAPNKFSRPGVVEFPRKFAECLNLSEKMQVTVTKASSGPRKRRKTNEMIEFIPNSADDYEVIELNQEVISGAILNQIAVINEESQFPVWIDRSYVRLQASRIPPPFHILQTDEQIAIKPIYRTQPASAQPDQFHCLRIQPSPSMSGPDLGQIFLSPQTAKELSIEVGNFIQINSLIPSMGDASMMRRSRCFKFAGENDQLSDGHVMLNEDDRCFFGLPAFSNVMIRLFPFETGKIQKIFLKKIHSLPHDCLFRPNVSNLTPAEERSIRLAFQKYCVDSPQPYLASGSLLHLSGSLILVSFHHSFAWDMAPSFIDVMDMSKVEVIFDPTEIMTKMPDWPLPLRYHNFHGFSEIVQQIWQHLSSRICSSFIKQKDSLGAGHILFGHVALVGPKGGGKSHALLHLAHRLQLEKQCKVIRFNSIEWIDAKISELFLHLAQMFMDALRNEPCVILFDDLDKLIHRPDDRNNMASIRVAQLAERVGTLMRCVQSNRVAVVCTISSWENLNDGLKQPGLISHKIQIESPVAIQRRVVLRNLAQDPQYGIDPLPKQVLQNITPLVEGYSVYDLVVLMESAVRYARSEDRTSLTTDDFQRVTEDYQPAAIKSVKLKESTVEWSQIGGLQDARSMLKETFEFPTKYKQLFDTAPIKLRSGLLLYGPPGCGKTMLASAVAKECGLNLISVKGPELLNKYIGASEQSIREVFGRAAVAAPCILFFDEFDAIAPRRGGDSTGVTDRVVNQLLSFLDGVESREGVYFLAASNRPDLIDVALLRPGRLDKSIFCDFPNAEDRLEILQNMCTNFDVPNDAIQHVSEETENYSGADLQSIITTAQLLFARQRMRGKTSESRLNGAHLLEALKDSKPSTSLSQRALLTRIYEEFSGKIIQQPNMKQKVVQK